MDTVVCVKQIIDTEAVVELDENGEVILAGQTLVMDPYSEFAVERAVQLKEERGGKVTLLCVGDQDCGTALRHGLAMGADEGLLIEDEGWAKRDCAYRARQLASVIDSMNPDLIMGGWKSGDTAHAQVMGRLAAQLGLPYENMVTAIEVQQDGFRITCEVDDGVEVVEVTGPVVIGAQQGLAEPRYPSVRDVMQARRRGIDSLANKMADYEENPVSGKKAVVKSRTLKTARKGGLIIEGNTADAVSEAVRLLAEEAKVI